MNMLWPGHTIALWFMGGASSVVGSPRLRWVDIPLEFRAAAESAVGSEVVGEVSQTGGFSPGLASRLLLADGRRVFAKAINSGRNPSAPGLYRRVGADMSSVLFRRHVGIHGGSHRVDHGGVRQGA